MPQVGQWVDGGPPEKTKDSGASSEDAGPPPQECGNALLDADAGETDVDCGGPCAPCGLQGRCATALDCLSGVCRGGSCAEPSGSCPLGYAGCTTFEDFTAESAQRVIQFPVGSDRFGPACVRVRFGQSITFEGPFRDHPLEQSCGPIATIATVSNGNSYSVTFDRALGVFGFFCSKHGTQAGVGMAGAVKVVR
ncbi:MAG: cupredoxin domain-containing protein [Myxococcota bacterium]